MAVPLKLAIDRQNKKLVVTGAVPGSVAALPPLFQGNSVDLEVTILDPSGLITSDYSRVDFTGKTLRVAVGQTPTGTPGGPAVLAIQTSFTYDSAANALRYSGNLALNTAAIDAFLGAAASATAYFEVNVVDSGNRSTILQATFNLMAVVDEAATTVPSPVDSYYTAAETDSRYVRKEFAAGDVILMTSADGTKKGLVYWGDDGSFHADPVT